jgi:hypothetical protein
MRDTPDKHRQPTLPYAKQAAAEAGLSERIKLPGPAQLAQIAAGFGVGSHPASAVKKAVSLYLRAHAFVAKHDKATVQDLADACEDFELASQLADAEVRAPLKPTLLLEPDKPQDQARRALAKSGLRLSRAKSVLENLRRCFRFQRMRAFLDDKKIRITWEDGKPLWPWGKPIESEAEAKCHMVTCKEYDVRTEAIAKEHGWREIDYESKWQTDLARISERRAEGRVVYCLPEVWLDELVKWKHSLKHSGGVRSRQAKNLQALLDRPFCSVVRQVESPAHLISAKQGESCARKSPNAQVVRSNVPCVEQFPAVHYCYCGCSYETAPATRDARPRIHRRARTLTPRAHLPPHGGEPSEKGSAPLRPFGQAAALSLAQCRKCTPAPATRRCAMKAPNKTGALPGDKRAENQLTQPANHTTGSKSTPGKKPLSKQLVIVRAMPPLSHWPDRTKPFDLRQSAVCKWLAAQPDVLNWLFGAVQQRDLILFDRQGRTWRGANNGEAQTLTSGLPPLEATTAPAPAELLVLLQQQIAETLTGIRDLLVEINSRMP